MRTTTFVPEQYDENKKQDHIVDGYRPTVPRPTGVRLIGGVR